MRLLFGAPFLLRKKPGFPLQSFGCAKRISAAIPGAQRAKNITDSLRPAFYTKKVIVPGSGNKPLLFWSKYL
jgi:hypothetical protein